MGPENDRNLLFAVLAVQLKGLSPERVMEIAVAWSADPSKTLAEHLRARNLVTEDDVALLERLADETVAACGDDTQRALDSISGGDTLRRSIAGVRPRPAQDTIPMGGEFPYEDGLELSGVKETPGRYSQISEYARGGMGRVLLVHDAHLGRDIALKELLIPHDAEKPSTAASPMRESAAVLERFLQEARITGQLEHPSIVPVYELGRRDNGTLYYTMRLVRGDTLSAALAHCKDLQGRLAMLKNVVDLCQALAYAHSRGVIHRDIKPSNIMIGEFGETVLLDWGLAKARGHEDLYEAKLQDRVDKLVKPGDRPLDTREGDVIGTPHYMAPEQAEGLISALDERSDIYAIGAVLYELLVGKPPYRGTSSAEILGKVLDGPPEPLRAINPELPPELVSICEKCMARDPQRRYGRMKDVAEDITRFQTGAFVLSYRYSAPEVFRRWYRKHRLVLNTAAVALLVLIAAGVLSYLSIWSASKREHDQRLAAEAARQKETIAREEADAARDRMETEHYYAQLNLAQARRESQEYASATKALWRIAPEKRDWVWGLLLNACNPDRFTIREDSTIQYGDWLPDGKRFLTMASGGPPKLWNGESGELIREFENGEGWYNTLKFSRDGLLLAATSANDNVTSWDVETGRVLSKSAYKGVSLGLAFDANQQHVWVGYMDGYVRAIDCVTGHILEELDFQSGPIGLLDTVAGAPLLLALTNEGNFLAYDLEQKAVRYTQRAQLMYLSPKGDKLLLLLSDPPVAVVTDTTTGDRISTLDIPAHNMVSACFSKAEDRVSVASVDGWTAVLDVSTGERVFQIGAGEPVWWSPFVDEDQKLVACTNGNRFYVYDLKLGEELLRYAGEGTILNVAPVTPDGRRLLSVPATKHAQVFDTLRPTGILQVVNPFLKNGWLTGLATAPSQETFAVTWGEKDTLVYDANDGPIASVVTSAAVNAHAAFCGGEEQLAYAGDGYTTILLNLLTGDARPGYVSDTPVYCITSSPDGEFLFTAGDSGVITQWRADDASPVRQFQGPSTVLALALVPGEDTLASGHADGEVRFWDIERGNLLSEVKAHHAPCGALAFSPDGLRWASYGNDDALYVWETRSEKRLLTYRFGGVQAWTRYVLPTVAFSPEGRFLSVRGFNQPSVVLSVETGDVVYRDGGFNSLLYALPERQEVMRFSSYGSVQRLVLPSPDIYTAEAEAAKSLYQDYKKRGLSVPGQVALSHVFAFVERNELRGTLSYLSGLTVDSGGNGGGLNLQTGQLPVGAHRYALKPGDAITGIDGRAWSTTEEAGARLEAVLASLGERMETTRFALVREDHPLTLSVITVPAKEIEEGVVTDEATLGAFLEYLLTALDSLGSDECPSLWVPVLAVSKDADREVLANVGLMASDRVIAIDGVPFGDASSAASRLLAVADHVRAGEAKQFRMDLQRGLGRLVHLTIEVQ